MKTITLPSHQTFCFPEDHMINAVKWVIKQVFYEKVYSPPGFEIGPSDTVIDIGANMGIFALYAASKAVRGKVIAVEPTSVINCLKSSIELNQTSNIEPIHMAIGNDGESLEITIHPHFNILNHGSAWRQPLVTRLLIQLHLHLTHRDKIRISKLKKETSPTISLATLIDKYSLQNIDLLKVDCEGAEYNLFRTLPPKYFTRINKMAIEFHEFDRTQRYKELLTILHQHGYSTKISRKFSDYFYCIGTIYAKKNSPSSG